MKRIMFITITILMLTTSGSIYEYLIIPPADHFALYHIWPKEKQQPVMPPRRNVPDNYKDLFDVTNQNYNLPPSVLESIAFVESRFRALAISPERIDGYQDEGMFQFNNKYHQWYSDQYNGGVLFDPYNPTEAIRIAALHVQFLFERYGNWMDVFLAYNAGMERIDKDVIPETAWDYLAKIYKE